MPRLNGRRFLALYLICLPMGSSCRNEPSDSPTTPDDTADTWDDETSGGTDFQSFTDFSGEVLFQDGTPGIGIVSLYGFFEKIRDTDPEGRFLFNDIPLGRWVFLNDFGSDHPPGAVVVDLLEEGSMEMSLPYVMLTWQHETVLEPDQAQLVPIGGGLHLSVEPGTFMAPGSVDDTTIFGAHVDSEAWPEISTLDGELVGLWYLGPFMGRFDPPAPIIVEGVSALEQGTELRLFAVDFDDADWIACGTATVQEDGSIETDAGSGVSLASTLALVL